jgi:hypothetical protein
VLIPGPLCNFYFLGSLVPTFFNAAFCWVDTTRLTIQKKKLSELVFLNCAQEPTAQPPIGAAGLRHVASSMPAA